MDMISQLPQPILHHILSLLSQKEAFQTCVLSKLWRYIGSTRPKIEFRESYFAGNKETFLSVLDKTIHRYHDQKLSIQEFCLEMSGADSDLISFLEKWIPIVMLNMGVKTFDFSFYWVNSAYFDLPSPVFESESLQKLCLDGCKLNQNSIDKVLFKHLKTLSLTRACIADETLDMILSNCPLIEYLVLDRCEGLRTINVNKSSYLKLFDFRDYGRLQNEDDPSIEINVPTIEIINIEGCPYWFHLHKYFRLLKSLYLDNVRLSSKSFDSFSCNFPCLEKLSLIDCYGFEEFQLSSRTIKHLIIECMDNPIKAVIDVPSLVEFEYDGDISRSFSFKKTASEWKSKIVVWCNVNFDFNASLWCLKLYEMLKALSESEISLDIMGNQHMEDLSLVALDTYGGFYEPVVVEHLRLRLNVVHSSYSSSVFINNLFHVCRPRNIDQFWYLYPQSEEETGQNKLSKFLRKILLWERERRDYLWQHDLEEVSMEEVFDDEDKDEVCFRLKWI